MQNRTYGEPNLGEKPRQKFRPTFDAGPTNVTGCGVSGTLTQESESGSGFMRFFIHNVFLLTQRTRMINVAVLTLGWSCCAS